MADPVTMVMMGIQAVGGIQEFNNSRAMAQATKQQTDANIKNQQAAFEIQRDQLKREQQQIAGKQLASAAGTGASLSSFSSLFEDTTRQSMVDQALLEYDNKLKQESIRYEGAVKKKQYYMQGRSALLKGVTGAASAYQIGSAGGYKGIENSINSNQWLGRQLSSSSYGPYKVT